MCVHWICCRQESLQAYDLFSHKIYIIRGIKFYENTFPFTVDTTYLHDKPSSLPLVSLDTPFDYFSAPNTSHTPTSEPTSTTPISPPPPPIQSVIPPTNPPRISNRTKNPPHWLNDYVCHVSNHTSLTPDFSSHYVTFFANVSKVQEPYSYSQAVKDPEWVKAMNT